MKKILLSVLMVFLFAGVAFAETFTMDVGVSFKNPFSVTAMGDADFGTVVLDSADKTIVMDISGFTLDPAPAIRSAAETAGATEVKKVAIKDDAGVAITTEGTPVAGYAIVTSGLADLDLKLACTELDPGNYVTIDEISGSHDLVNGDAAVKVTRITTNLSKINAATFVPAAGNSMPLYLAPTIKVASPEMGKSYSGTLNFDLALQ